MHTTKLDQCEHLFTLLEVERLPIATVANRLDMSEYGVRQLRKDPDYITIRTARRTEMREDAITQIHEIGHEALDTMRNLLFAKSELVRFNAAKQLGDWMGLGNLRQQAEDDEREELTDFLKELLAQKQQVTVNVNLDIPLPHSMPPPSAGGLLPAFTGGWTPDWIDAMTETPESDTASSPETPGDRLPLP